MNANELEREPLDPAFPQEIAWAVSALTYLTTDENWPGFYAFLAEDNGIVDAAGPEEMRDVAQMAANKLHGIGHNMVERRRAMMDLPPFLRQILGVDLDDADDDDDDDDGSFEDVNPGGNYLLANARKGRKRESQKARSEPSAQMRPPTRYKRRENRPGTGRN